MGGQNPGPRFRPRSSRTLAHGRPSGHLVGSRSMMQNPQHVGKLQNGRISGKHLFRTFITPRQAHRALAYSHILWRSKRCLSTYLVACCPPSTTDRTIAITTSDTHKNRNTTGGLVYSLVSCLFWPYLVLWDRDRHAPPAMILLYSGTLMPHTSYQCSYCTFCYHTGIVIHLSLGRTVNKSKHTHAS